MILDAIEVSIVLPALPGIARALGLSLGTAQWLMSGFALGFALVLVSGPAVVARFGRRPVYLGAMGLFVLASVVGGSTDSVGLLVACRVLKGAAAAATAPAGLAVIMAEYPAGPEQRRAISIYALFGAAGFTTGLLLSGGLAALNWHLVLLFPAPIAAALLVLGGRVFPAAAAARAPWVWSPPRNPTLVRSALGAATLNGAYVSLLLLITARLADHGHPAWQIALALLPASLPLTVATPFAGRLVARTGTARPIFAGAVAAATGELWFLARPGSGSYLWDVLPVLLLVEAGFVLSFAALNMQATATLAVERRPAAIPFYQAGVQLGAALLLPITVALSGSHRAAATVIAVVGVAGVVVAAAELVARRTSDPSGGLAPSLVPRHAESWRQP
ncbi:MFS transporter [Nocardia stercoris]|uniref:MFS transporter n=2 Tax=Nocardia stercoris TaxID=2483361 RepID=A0A3M2L3B1_9NOCA|nr:MFS transporter [Nocardia stercoris]